MAFCKCNAEIHPKRVEFLKKNNLPLTCINCSSTQKVVGFQVVSGKTEREIQVCTPAQAAELEAKARRAGTGVSAGVKMKHYSVGDNIKPKK